MAKTERKTGQAMSGDNLNRRVDYLILALLILSGAVLRFYHLDTALWYDEIVTLLGSVRPSLAEIVTHFPSNNDHPLYSVLAHISVNWLGEQPWSLRLPSAVFGIAAIPMLYLLGRSVTTRLEALLAASLLTVSYHHIWFSQNARGYTALLFFVLLSTYLLLRWMSGAGNRYAAAYAVAIAIGSYAHLTMVFVCLSHALICAISYAFGPQTRKARRERGRVWLPFAATFAGAGALTILLYLPMVPDMLVFFTTQRAAANEVATPVWALLAAIRELQVGFGTLWALSIGGLIVLAGLWSYYKLNRAALFVFFLPVPVTLALAVAMGRPVFPRFVFFAAGFALLTVVRGSSSIGSWLAGSSGGRISPLRAGAFAALLVTVVAIALSFRSLPYGYRYPKQDYVQAANFIEQNRNAEDLVAVVGDTGAIPVLDYLGKPWQRINDANELQKLHPGVKAVWVLYTFPAYILADEPELWSMLQAECEQLGEFEGTVAGGTIHVSRCNQSLEF